MRHLIHHEVVIERAVAGEDPERGVEVIGLVFAGPTPEDEGTDPEDADGETVHYLTLAAARNLLFDLRREIEAALKSQARRMRP